MCAISPLTTEEVVEGVDDGYSTPNDSPIPPDRSGVPGGAGVQPDEIVDTDDEDCFKIDPPKEPVRFSCSMFFQVKNIQFFDRLS